MNGEFGGGGEFGEGVGVLVVWEDVVVIVVVVGAGAPRIEIRHSGLIITPYASPDHVFIGIEVRHESFTGSSYRPVRRYNRAARDRSTLCQCLPFSCMSRLCASVSWCSGGFLVNAACAIRWWDP
jgi:hypothetical protein